MITMEPDPANVEGRVVRSHSFEHRINWGHVAIAVAVLAVLYRVGPVFVDEGNSEGDSVETEVQLTD